MQHLGGRPRQAHLCEAKVNLLCIAGSRPIKATWLDQGKKGSKEGGKGRKEKKGREERSEKGS